MGGWVGGWESFLPEDADGGFLDAEGLGPGEVEAPDSFVLGDGEGLEGGVEGPAGFGGLLGGWVGWWVGGFGGVWVGGFGWEGPTFFMSTRVARYSSQMRGMRERWTRALFVCFLWGVGGWERGLVR